MMAQACLGDGIDVPQGGTRSGQISVRQMEQFARLGVYSLCFFDYGIRNFAPLFLAAALLCSVACLNTSSLRTLKAFVPLWIVGLFYIPASMLHLLDPAWTLYWHPGAVAKQALWIAIFPLLTTLAQTYVGSVLAYHLKRELWIVSLLTCANFLVSGFLISDWTYSIWSYGPFGYLWAPFSIFLTVVLWSVLVSSRYNLVILIIAVGVIGIVLADSAQTKFAYLVVMAMITVGVNRRITALGIVLLSVGGIAAGYVWGWIDPVAAYMADPNSGIRALMAKGAFEAAHETWFMGVGYGTEGIRNYYPEVGIESFNYMDDNFIMIATHNGFFDVLMRLGIPGLASILFIFIGLIAGPCPERGNFGFRMAIFTLVFINMSVNVALQSPFHLAGITFMLGSCTALTDLMERRYRFRSVLIG